MLFGSVILGGFMRALFGRLFGAAASGAVIGVIGWLVAGSLIGGVVMAGAAFLIVLIAGDFASAAPGRGGYSSGGWSGSGSGWNSGSSWSSGSSDSSSDSGGGGGSFGGGGASGSW
jgi:uncharacterized protein